MPSDRQKRYTLIAAILGSAIVFIDGTVVNVALPAIRRDLHAGLATQQWVIEAYLLTLSSLILIGGSLSDLFGRRRIFMIGVVGFGATSILCAVAPTAPLLVAARGLQGAAGALLVPSALAVIVDTFDDDERGGAIGSWTAWGGVSTLLEWDASIPPFEVVHDEVKKAKDFMTDRLPGYRESISIFEDRREKAPHPLHHVLAEVD